LFPSLKKEGLGEIFVRTLNSIVTLADLDKDKMAHSSVNPITVEVVRNGLAHIANEMATVLRKTSYNMMIYEVRDYCVGIVDPDGNILSQNFGALPIFLADLGPAIVDGVRMHGRDGFKPGDVLIMLRPALGHARRRIYSRAAGVRSRAGAGQGAAGDAIAKLCGVADARAAGASSIK
jgi:hypothetical protein